MSFPERAVIACVAAMKKGKVSGHQVRNVLKYKDVDVSRIEPFLNSPYDMVRRNAIRIIGSKGRCEALVCRAQIEEDRTALLEILKFLGERKHSNLDELVYLLQIDDSVVKQAAIQMFRKADPEFLTLALFDPDDGTVGRVKRYIINEKGTRYNP